MYVMLLVTNYMEARSPLGRASPNKRAEFHLAIGKLQPIS